MSVAGPSRRPPSCRRRKRLRPGVGWWGSPVRFIVDLGCGYPFLVWFDFLWLLFSGVWETLIFGTGDWFAFGEPFFCGLFTPTNPLPGHRLVPESHVVRSFHVLGVWMFGGALTRCGKRGSTGMQGRINCWAGCDFFLHKFSRWFGAPFNLGFRVPLPSMEVHRALARDVCSACWQGTSFGECGPWIYTFHSKNAG